MPELVPVDHDPFASGGTPNLVPVDHDPFAAPSVPADVLASFGSGAAKGGISLAGLGGDAREALIKGATWLSEKLGHPVDPEMLSAAIGHGVLRGPTSEQIKTQVDKVAGQPYEPQTTAGKYAGAVGEFVPAAIAGGGNVIGNAARYAVGPGIASQAAGDAVKGTPLEDYAPAIQGAAAVATGGVGAILSRPGTPEAAIRRALPAGTNAGTIGAAENLMRDAQAQGINLSWAEAIDHVAPGTDLPPLQRIVEGAPQSRGIMREFYGNRPAQVEAASGPALNTLGPASQQPQTLGPQAARAATEEVNAVRGAINDAAEPYYTRASVVRLTPQEMARVRALPGFADAAQAVRDNPQLARYVQGMPEDSVGFLNEVKKQLDTGARNAAGPVNPQRNQQVASGLASDATVVRTAARNASPDFQTALDIQANGRQQFLQPLLDGPLGQIAKKDMTTQRAISVLFPTNPLPHSAADVRTAVGNIALRRPAVATQLVRAHVESVFNEATQNLVGGEAQRGGAKFASVLAGNPQQRANLQAAVEALPNGADRWRGFERFLDVLEATGKRPEMGSLTAFNAQGLAGARSGRGFAEVAKTALSPGKWWNVIGDKWSQWQAGSNLGELATILTDPRSGPLLRQIAGRPTDSRDAQVIALRLAGILNQSAHYTPKQPNAAGN